MIVFIIFALMETFKHGSLFSGIGGFDLAAEWMGWENLFHCEWNEFGQKVLKYYWPKAESFTDITKSDFTHYANKIDILTGGFPCQPYSTAGKRKGKDDERHLWPEMLRAIREISPRYVVGENVRGLTNWNGGLVFDEVCAELEAIGYQVAPVIIPACGVNAPHRRERIWFVAYNPNRRIKGMHQWAEHQNKTISSTNSKHLRCTQCEQQGKSRCEKRIFKGVCGNGNVTNTNSSNNKTRTFGQILGQQNREKTNGHSNVERSNQWENFPTQSPVCGGDDGLPTKLDGITFSKWRAESIKGYGNAIVPQIAHQLFQILETL